MRASTAIGPVFHLRCCATWLVLFVVSETAGQVGQFGIPVTSAELSPPRVEVVSGSTATRLKQARLASADQQWDEAVDIYRELSAAPSDRVIAIDEQRFVGLRGYCHLQLARLPAEGLAAYRRRVDQLAEQWYHEGIVSRDEQTLRRIVDEFYCSSRGDDALLALGDLALERADYDDARIWWEQISPRLRDLNGLPHWLSLCDVDLSTWPEAEGSDNVHLQPETWLAYPDSDLDLAAVRARLVLTSIRTGELERAKVELSLFRQLHPNATGKFAGQEGPYAATLERLLDSAATAPESLGGQEWRTFAGSLSRDGIAAPLPPDLEPIWETSVAIARSQAAPIQGESSTEGDIETITPSGKIQPNSFPVTVNRKVLFADQEGIHAVDMLSGQPTVSPDGLLHRNETSKEPAASVARGNQFGFASSVAFGSPRYTLTSVGKIVYGRVGTATTSRLDTQRAANDSIVGLDLSRDGLLTFRVTADDEAWAFDGVPVSDGRRVFVAMRRGGVAPQAFVACYDVANSGLKWRTPICSADTPAAGRGDEITHNLLTLVGDRLYFNTNLGLVAAIDAVDGSIEWLCRYERYRGQLPEAGKRPAHFDRDPSPCLYHAGQIFVAPADSPSVFALDAATGQQIWKCDKLAEVHDLLGVVEENLIVTGKKLWVIDVHSGEVRQSWPAVESADITGMGRGMIASSEVFFPTRESIHVLSAITGKPTRAPMSLEVVGSGGANLASSHGYLIVAGSDKLMAFGTKSQNSASLRTGRFGVASNPE